MHDIVKMTSSAAGGVVAGGVVAGGVVAGGVVAGGVVAGGVAGGVVAGGVEVILAHLVLLDAGGGELVVFPRSPSLHAALLS
jgi:hypothetical protein